MASILVLGAGMVGVSTALALQARGHSVALVDKRAPGRETSFGNAGIIQMEAAEPYAVPRDAGTLTRYGLGLSNDLAFSLRGLAQMLPALWTYYRQSAPERHRQIGAVYHRLTARAGTDHAPLIASAGADNLVSRDGLVLMHRRARDFEAACREAERLARAYGITSRTLSGVAYRAEEPALTATPAGALHFPQSWSVRDPGELTAAYARLFARRGGTIARGDAHTLARRNGGFLVTTEAGPLDAERAVIALGPWSPALLARFGLHVPMVLKRGYHAHYRVPLAPRRPFLDAANGVLAAPMAMGLRISTGAAIVPQHAPPDPKQLRQGRRALSEIIALGDQVEAEPWHGTRPCLPGMLPFVGRVPGDVDLWVNTGHGHHGFTLGPTTGTLLAEAMDGACTPLHSALAPKTHPR